MNRKLVVLAALAAAVLGGGIWTAQRRHRTGRAAADASARRYYCPMHPDYTSDKPGDCPICNMALVPMEEEAREKTVSLKKICLLHNCKMADCAMELPLTPGQKITCPVCGTHVAEAAKIARGKPLYYRNPMRPDVTSPVPMKDEMGMDYVPVYAQERPGETDVQGQAAVTLSAERRRMIGMKSEPVRRRSLARTVRASGRVAYDPDLYNAVAEYRAAVKARSQLQDSPWPDVHERAEALVRASELKLRQIGISEEQIADSLKAERQPTTLLLGGAGGGVWVYAQIYEYEIGLVRQGQPAEITAPAYPGRTFRGVVKAVDPILSAETRSLKVRIEVPNPEGALKLEMFVNAAIQVGLGRRLALPEDALIDTGERKVAFVDLGEGRIEPREVRVGAEAQGFYELLSGVSEGERVVTSANFLVDSESRLKAAIGRARRK